jgi:hypothetical protein
MKALVFVLLTGCVSTSQVGPYVKHVQRNGDWLVIHKCMIVLEDKELHEASCTVEQLPLAAVSQMAPPAQQLPPVAPPVQQR